MSQRAFGAHVLRRFEFFALLSLAFVGLVVPLVLSDPSTGTAVLVTVVGLAPVVGAVQWADRARQRHLRARAIAEIRERLADRVLNQRAAAYA